jgi:predicted nucleic acid-binding protein
MESSTRVFTADDSATRRIGTPDFSFGDGLAVEFAIESGVQHLLTDGLQDGQSFGQQVIRNPFATEA